LARNALTCGNVARRGTLRDVPRPVPRPDAPLTCGFAMSAL
jgi:hypothetical protein